MSEIIKGKEYKNLGLRDLQEVGLQRSADLGYRTEVASRMANRFGATKALLFDDPALAVPEAQRGLLHGLPGYERALMPGLLTAPGFRDGAAVLVTAPPNPVEMRSIHLARQELSTRLARPITYEILHEQNGQLVNLMEIAPRNYYRLCEEYASSLNHPDEAKKFTADYALNTVATHSSDLFSDGQTLVLPFQVTPLHKDILGSISQSRNVSLPDVPNIDKAFNNLYLKDHGFKHLPDLYVVTASGRVIDSYQEFEAHTSTSEPVPTNQDTIKRFAAGVIEAIDRLGRQQKGAYVKLDSNGVSGLGNLDPDDFAEVYDTRHGDYERRVATLSNAIAGINSEYLPNSAVIEEFVEAEAIEGVTKDYTVCGQMVDGIFLPLSMNPVGTTKGVYDRQWTGPNAESLGEDPKQWRDMFEAYAEMGDILAGAGYRDGQMAGDIFVRPNEEGYAQHDYNFRRGGRSTPEALLALDPRGWFEAQAEVPLPTNGSSLTNKDILTVYTQVLHTVHENGWMPFSTAFGYFSKGAADGDYVKYKTLIPTDRFYNGTRIPRNQHLEAVQLVLEQLTNAAIKEL